MTKIENLLDKNVYLSSPARAYIQRLLESGAARDDISGLIRAVRTKESYGSHYRGYKTKKRHIVTDALSNQIGEYRRKNTMHVDVLNVSRKYSDDSMSSTNVEKSIFAEIKELIAKINRRSHSLVKMMRDAEKKSQHNRDRIERLKTEIDNLE